MVKLLKKGLKVLILINFVSCQQSENENENY